VANLVDNAVRHNVSRGWLDIRVTADGGRASLAVTNTGPVIPADQVGRLLEPFQRLSGRRPADDAAGLGLGLGLSIAAAIARAHQATLAISPGPAGGLAVDINFPAAVCGTPAPERALAAV